MSSYIPYLTRPDIKISCVFPKPISPLINYANTPGAPDNIMCIQELPNQPNMQLHFARSRWITCSMRPSAQGTVIALTILCMQPDTLSSYFFRNFNRAAQWKMRNKRTSESHVYRIVCYGTTLVAHYPTVRAVGVISPSPRRIITQQSHTQSLALWFSTLCEIKLEPVPDFIHCALTTADGEQRGIVGDCQAHRAFCNYSCSVPIGITFEW